MWQKEKLLVLSNFFFCRYVFKKPSASEASESIYMRERVDRTEKGIVANQFIFLPQLFHVICFKCIKMCLLISGKGFKKRFHLIQSSDRLNFLPTCRLSAADIISVVAKGEIAHDEFIFYFFQNIASSFSVVFLQICCMQGRVKTINLTLITLLQADNLKNNVDKRQGSK